MKTKLSNVRLSFPSLFTKVKFKESEPKYEATFLLDKTKDKEFIEELKEELKGFLSENGIEKPKIVTKAIDSIIRDGEEKDYEGYENAYSIKGRSLRRIMVVDRDKTPLTEDDEKLYAGCMVNAIINFYLVADGKEKKLCAGLTGVQFSQHGEPFGGDNAGDLDMFDDLEDEF